MARLNIEDDDRLDTRLPKIGRLCGKDRTWALGAIVTCKALLQDQFTLERAERGDPNVLSIDDMLDAGLPERLADALVEVGIADRHDDVLVFDAWRDAFSWLIPGLKSARKRSDTAAKRTNANGTPPPLANGTPPPLANGTPPPLANGDLFAQSKHAGLGRSTSGHDDQEDEDRATGDRENSGDYDSMDGGGSSSADGGGSSSADGGGSSSEPSGLRTPDRSKRYISPRFDFERLYRLYPRKEGKAGGIAHCRSQIKTQRDYELLERAILSYAERCRMQGTEQKFIRHFESFMSKGRWRDYVDESAPAPAGSPPNGAPAQVDAYERWLLEEHAKGRI